MNELQKLMDEISEWSDATFGYEQRSKPIAHHLKKEVDELIIALKITNIMSVDETIKGQEFIKQVGETENEYADCFMLILDSAKHFGIDAERLIEITRNKLETNKKRTWGKPDENGVVEHVCEPKGVK